MNDDRRPVSCPRCGRQRASHDKFCGGCGRLFDEPPADQPTEVGAVATVGRDGALPLSPTLRVPPSASTTPRRTMVEQGASDADGSPGPGLDRRQGLAAVESCCTSAPVRAGGYVLVISQPGKPEMTTTLGASRLTIGRSSTCES